MEKEYPPIVVEQTFSVSPKEVWKAITEQPLMVRWFFENIPDFKAEVGFETEFNVNSGNRDFLHQWKVLEVEPEKKIAYTWTYAQYPGDGKVIFEIYPQNQGATLKVTALGMETFPSDIPEFNRKNCLAGWHYFIRERLKAFLG